MGQTSNIAYAPLQFELLAGFRGQHPYPLLHLLIEEKFNSSIYCLQDPKS